MADVAPASNSPYEAPSLLVVGEAGVFSCALPEQGDTVIGRGDDCDVVVDDPTMSRRHLILRTTAARTIEVIDLGGVNGTRVGERRLEAQAPLAVGLGATITAGSTVIVLRTRAQAAAGCRLVSHAELRAVLAAECNRAGATQGFGETFALVKARTLGTRDARAVEEVLAGSLRAKDVVAGIALGSYVILLPETSSAGAIAFASRMAALLARRGVEVGMHVATFPHDGDTPDRLDSSDGTPIVAAPSSEDEEALFVGSAMRSLEPAVDAIAATGRPAIVLGEVGTGKELVARAIHARSSRRRGPFVALEGEGLARVLAACALGATPAEVAGGCLFIDEIAELPIAAQDDLLQAMKRRESPRAVAEGTVSDVRFLAASRRDLRAASDRGSLRAELLRRFERHAVTVPPLRARVDAIEPLAKAFARDACAAAGRDHIRIAAPALAWLRNHDWPGNVRELREVIEEAVANAAGDTIGVEDLPRSSRIPHVAVRDIREAPTLVPPPGGKRR